MNDRRELEEIARMAADKAVAEMLVKLGIDTTDPFEMQRDFQHLRSWRVSSETIKTKAVIAAIGILIAGVCGAIWLAIKGH